MAYQKPMTKIYQEFTQIPNEIVEPLRAVIVGPQFDLIRYSEASEKADGYLGTYDHLSDQVFAWPNRPVGGVADLDYTSVFVENALLQYFTDAANGGATTIYAVFGYQNRIRAASINWATYGANTRYATLYDRDVQIGDVVKVEALVDDEIVSLTSTVKSLIHEVTASVVDDAEALSTNQADVASDTVTAIQADGEDSVLSIEGNIADYDGFPSGRFSETYLIECLVSNEDGDETTAILSYTSGDGLDSGTFSPEEHGSATTVGTRGLTITWDVASSDSGTLDFEAGQSWLVTISKSFAGPTVSSAGTYTGPEDTTYIIEVTTGGTWSDSPKVSVSTTNGTDLSGPHTVASATAGALSIGIYGVTIEFEDADGLRLGDTWVIPVTAAGLGALKTIELSNSLPADLRAVSESVNGPDLSITLYIKKDIELAKFKVEDRPNKNWDCDSSGITLKASATAYDSSWKNGSTYLPLSLKSSTLSTFNRVFTTCRYLLTANCGEVRTVTSLADVDALGPISPDNPLAIACYAAVLNANGTPVRYCSLCEDSLSGYLDALDVLSSRQDIWGVVPCSMNSAVKDAVKSHVLAMSTPEKGRWRRAFVSTDLVEETALVTRTTSGSTSMATIEEDPVSSGSYTILTSSNVDFITNGVTPGDVVRFNYQPDGEGGWEYDEYTVDLVLSEDSLQLVSGPSTEVVIAKKFEVYHPNTTAEMALQVAAESGRLKSARVANVFPNEISMGGEVVQGWVLAAAVAGLKSGVVPQQGLTNLSLTGFDNADVTSKFFTDAELDVMADSGTLLVVQEDSAPYSIIIRHQLTTDRTSLNTQELSIQAVMDACSYVMLSRLKSFTGRSNITPGTLSEISTAIEAALIYLMSIADTPLAGPIILDNSKLLDIYQHPSLLDHVYSEVELEIGKPLNTLIIKLQA
jgi:hypothetical protein